MQVSKGTEAQAPRPAGRLVGSCDVRLWSLPQAERWSRALGRVGIVDLGPAEGPLPAAGSVVLVRTDHVLDDGSIRALVARPGCLLAIDAPRGGRRAVAAHVDVSWAAEVAALLAADGISGAEPATAGLKILSPAELGSSHNEALRKRARPFALALSEATRDEAERLTFAGAYKGVTDFVTKYVWPAPARAVTRWCAACGVSPNVVTSVSLIFVLLALWQFAIGHFWIGLAAAWVMTFLDTVDGKLARVTLTSSRWGNVFDHGIDLIHPPFWYWAWWYGLVSSGEPAALWAVSGLALAVVIVGYVAQRLLEGLFIWRFGMEMHVWRRIDSQFRLITARRNPNLVILTLATACGRPDLGFGLVAVWTALSFLFHALQVVQAAIHQAGGRPFTSWLSGPEKARNA